MKNIYLRTHFWNFLTHAKSVLVRLVGGIGTLLLNQEQPLRLEKIKKILIIHGEHASIGDAVLFSSIFTPLRARFPRARIEVLMRHPAEEAIKYNKNIDEIIPYTAEENSSIITQEFAPFRIAGKLKKRKYDLVITSEHAFRFIVLSYLTGAPNRIGYDSEGRGFLLTRKVKYPPYEKRDKRELEYYLDLVRALGIDVQASKEMMKVHYSKKEKKFAEEFFSRNVIRKGDLIVGMHAGGGIWKKRWPLFKFAKLADALIEKYDAKVIAFGGKEDVLLMEQMQKMMKNKLITAAGKTNVLETAALLERCKLVIANDSAISHIAATTNAKVITLFGVDSPVRWGPFGNVAIMKHKRLPACNLICNYNYLYAVDACFQEEKPFCMDLIGVDDVLKEVGKALKY